MALMLVPPPRTLPIACTIERLFTLGLRSAPKFQSNSPPRLKNQVSVISAGLQIIAAGLEQQNLRIAVLCQAARNN